MRECLEKREICIKSNHRERDNPCLFWTKTARPKNGVPLRLSCFSLLRGGALHERQGARHHAKVPTAVLLCEGRQIRPNGTENHRDSHPRHHYFDPIPTLGSHGTQRCATSSQRQTRTSQSGCTLGRFDHRYPHRQDEILTCHS